MTFQEMVLELEDKIQYTYENGVSIDEAERLAAQFLYAQMQVSNELKNFDLDARMQKTGLKAIKAAMYTEAVSKSDKKPTEAQLDHSLNSSKVVQVAQDDLDRAESTRDDLERYFNIFTNAHIFFRSVSKGKFE